MKLGATCATLGALASLPALVLAQDFAFVAGAGPLASPAAYLERGLPPESDEALIEASSARWFGLDDWATHAVAGSVSFGAARIAAGLSRTGDPELGWHAASLAFGAVTDHAGASFRLIARHDRDELALGAPDPRAGGEAGGGVWVRAAEGFQLWASAPQLWVRGAEPPLARPLEIGGALAAGAARVWVTQSFMTRGLAMASRRAAGAEIRADAGAIGIHARERPLRAGASATAYAGRIVAGLGVESHPALGETWSLSLALAYGGRR